MDLENTVETTSTESQPQSMQDATDAAIKSFESNQTSTQESASQPPQSQTAQSLTDIGKLERFIYDGKELTPAELKKAMMFQQDYTKKTKELSQYKKDYDSIKSYSDESKKFRENLAIDLESVSKNPALASEFMKVYPKEFHKLLDYAIKQEQQEAKVLTDPRLDEIDKLKEAYTELHEEKVEKASLEIDNAFKEFSQKYPLSNEPDVVVALERVLENKLKAAMENGENPKRVKLDMKDYERVFKASHEYHDKRFNQHYSKQFNKQKEVNEMAKATGTGGATPSGAPQKLKTFKDAEAAVMNAIESGSI